MILSSSSLMLTPALIWLFLTSTASLSSNETTFPCPGYTRAGNFSDIPLADRPSLERILQNGFSLSGLEATVPVRSTTDPDISWLSKAPNTVAFEKGFVQRPFRRISNDICADYPEGIFKASLVCNHYSSTGITIGSSSYNELVRGQLRLEASIGTLSSGEPLETERIRNNVDNESGNSDSFQAWEDTVAEFIGCSEAVIDGGYPVKYPTRVVDSQNGGCSVNSNCFEFEPDFLDDLTALQGAVVIATNRSSFSLPWSDPAVSYDREAFVTFTNTWGHGAVDRFDFGQQFVSLYKADEGGNGSWPVLYLGRAGGTEPDPIETDEMYTDDECLDPQPSVLDYSRWDELLSTRNQFWWGLQPWGTSPRISEEVAEYVRIGFEFFYYELRQENYLWDQSREDFTEADCTATLSVTLSPTLGLTSSTTSPIPSGTTPGPTPTPTAVASDDSILSALPSGVNDDSGVANAGHGSMFVSVLVWITGALFISV
mmetsp:Transcript_21254/g.24466  ORF Transcript_21254/g.24466 Transcript_21254/m.24466 type:complete len:486 (+) Transcript_21254:172-1629(+)